MKQLDIFKYMAHNFKPYDLDMFESCPISEREKERRKRGRVKRKVSPQETSLAAYRSLENITELQDVILYALELDGGMTDTRLVDNICSMEQHRGRGRVKTLRATPSSIRTRRSELVKLGKVRDSGKREKLPSGRLAIVWCLT